MPSRTATAAKPRTADYTPALDGEGVLRCPACWEAAGGCGPLCRDLQSGKVTVTYDLIFRPAVEAAEPIAEAQARLEAEWDALGIRTHLPPPDDDVLPASGATPRARRARDLRAGDRIRCGGEVTLTQDAYLCRRIYATALIIRKQQRHPRRPYAACECCQQVALITDKGPRAVMADDEMEVLANSQTPTTATRDVTPLRHTVDSPERQEPR